MENNSCSSNCIVLIFTVSDFCLYCVSVEFFLYCMYCVYLYALSAFNCSLLSAIKFVFCAVQMFLYDAFGSRNLAVSIGECLSFVPVIMLLNSSVCDRSTGCYWRR